MTITAPASAPPRLLKRALLLGCSLAGLGAMTGAAQAQAFNGTPGTQAGSVTYDRATPGVETVRINSPQAVILWAVASSNFLPAGNTATFFSTNADFAVLNRLIFLGPAPLRFDGTVLSRLIDGAGNSRTGGTVVFYSPNGIIVGQTGLFDVGNLVLTALDIPFKATGEFYDPATRGLNFFLGGGPSPNANAAVVTEIGAQIRALQPGSFVALVGPVVQHGGSVRVNGSAAYIAGEQVTFSANQGLFDIVITTGSGNAQPLTHTGSTGGPSNVAAGDNHAIYMVAMPKNQAITAVLQGDIGFDPAVTAGVENGVIVLSAGANVVAGAVDRYGDLTGTPAADLQANFEIRGGIVRSDLTGVARNNILAQPIATTSLTFQQDVSLFGTQSALMQATRNTTIDVLGKALVSADAFDTITGNFNLTGGLAAIRTLDGGTIHIVGAATVDASARGLVGPGGQAGSGTGGTATVNAAGGGTITVDGALFILANGEGASSVAAPLNDGGAGTGGTANLGASLGGTVNANGSVAMSANGTASASGAGATVNGATGAGGTVNVAAAGTGTIAIKGIFTAAAIGTGGEVGGGAGLTGGLGDGGTISVTATDANIDFNADAAFLAAGGGGLGPTGGLGQGGDLRIEATRGTIDFLGQTNGGAGGFGGAALIGGPGGNGLGGTILIAARSSDAPSRIGGGAFSLNAQGQGGRGGNGIVGIVAGNGGAGTGGNIDLVAESANGTLNLGALKIGADGLGGDGGAADNNTDGGDGGLGQGGNVQIGTVGGPAPGGGGAPTGSATFAIADLSARGTGGFGGFGAGTGGNGLGGRVGVAATGAPTTVTGGTTLVADGQGSPGGGSPGGAVGAGGTGTGGVVTIGAASHPVSNAPGTLTLAAVTGSAGGLGDGPGNLAGEWHVNANGGSTVTATDLTLTAAADGTGIGIPQASSLDPQGGTITVTGTARLGTDGDILINATGAGRITGGRYELTAGRDVVMNHSTPVVGGFTVDAGNLFVQAGRDVTVNAGVVTRTTDITDLRAVRLATISGSVLGRDLRIGAADLIETATGAVGTAATETVDIQVTNNAAVSGQILGLDILLGGATINVATTGRVGSAASTSTELRSTGNTNVDGIVLGRAVQLTAGSLGVSASGAIGDATSQTVDIQVAGNAAISGQVLGQDILLSAATINVATTGRVGSAASTSTELRSTGNTSVDGIVLGRDVLVTAGSLGVGAAGAIGDATTQTNTLQITGNAAVSGQVLGRTILVNAAAIDVAGTGQVGGAGTDLADLNATGTIGVSGRLRGTAIRLASADIDLTATGTVGDATTQLVTLAVRPSAQSAVLGGTTQGPGYTLTGAEAGRIRAETLRVSAATPGANPAIIVRDLTLAGGGAAAGIGLLDIVTPGVVRVEGALLMTGARAADGIAIAAGQRLEVPTTTGSIRVRDGAGAPGGTLALNSANLWIASPAIIALLSGNANYLGRNDDLIDNDGVDAPRGYVEANRVTLTVNGTAFVQNTTAARGTFLTGADFGGITTGAGGLTIIAAVPGTNVYAFGRRLNPDGSFTTGDTYFFQGTYNSNAGAGYTAAAAVNTCIIVTGQCPLRVPPDNGLDGPDPFVGPTDGSMAIMLPQSDQDDLIDSSFSADALIEEPVTSGSEPDLWNCDPDHDGDCDDQPQ